MDLIYLGLVCGFFIVTWGLVRLCHVLGGQR
jgi:hypothetical protein